MKQFSFEIDDLSDQYPKIICEPKNILHEPHFSALDSQTIKNQQQIIKLVDFFNPYEQQLEKIAITPNSKTLHNNDKKLHLIKKSYNKQSLRICDTHISSDSSINIKSKYKKEESKEQKEELKENFKQQEQVKQQQYENYRKNKKSQQDNHKNNFEKYSDLSKYDHDFMTLKELNKQNKKIIKLQKQTFSFGLDELIKKDNEQNEINVNNKIIQKKVKKNSKSKRQKKIVEFTNQRQTRSKKILDDLDEVDLIQLKYQQLSDNIYQNNQQINKEEEKQQKKINQQQKKKSKCLCNNQIEKPIIQKEQIDKNCLNLDSLTLNSNIPQCKPKTDNDDE